MVSLYNCIINKTNILIMKRNTNKLILDKYNDIKTPTIKIIVK